LKSTSWRDELGQAKLKEGNHGRLSFPFMHVDPQQSLLQRSGLASGLLSQHQLEDALSGLIHDMLHRYSGGGENVATPESTGDVCSAPPFISDELLGQRLIDLGYLNRWQVEQLKEGRTKFTLGPYRILNAIGRGGMGHVFKAEHKLLGRVEAIKVLPKTKSTPEAIAAFQREIRAQAQLDHPNLVRVSYADFEGETYFLVTEFVPGTDLRRLVRRNGPLPFAIAATIVSQSAEALHYAHRRGLVHRDVKPGNLLVTPEGHTKITDLGLAWFLLDEPEIRAGGKPNTLVGTADYLAPESIRQPDRILPVSDVYSLGCTLYYAVTGKVPFPGGRSAEKMRRHLEEPPLNPLHFNPDLPPAFCDVVAIMMDKKPDKRTPTAAAVVELLRPWCDASATKNLAVASATASGMFYTGGRPVSPPIAALDETATFVLDENETTLGQVESPSQISQGTTPIAAEGEDTLPHAPMPRPTRVADAGNSFDSTGRFLALAAVLIVGFAAILAGAIWAVSWIR
jgi:eukaryotic-like serine/threonine-protein kinase